MIGPEGGDAFCGLRPLPISYDAPSGALESCAGLGSSGSTKGDRSSERSPLSFHRSFLHGNCRFLGLTREPLRTFRVMNGCVLRSSGAWATVTESSGRFSPVYTKAGRGRTTGENN
jgi:hypothetical protein